MSDYLRSVVSRRWKAAVIAFVVFVVVGMIGYGELHWILFSRGDYGDSELFKILAIFGLLHLMSYGAALAVMLLYKNNIDTNIGVMGPLQKRMLVAAIQAEIDMDGNVVDIKEGKRGIR